MLNLAWTALVGLSVATVPALPNPGLEQNDLSYQELPKSPSDMPKWLNAPGADHLFYKPAPYNWAITRIPLFAKDMYATGVGHAMAYEALVRGQAPQLETKIFSTIDRVLKNQPAVPVDEGAISPTFLRKYGYLEKVFDWAHTLHFQVIDVFMHPGWTDAQKEAEVERLWQFYAAQPYAITGLPMNMEYLDSFPYSGKFRKEYPKVNGLFWGYHWLQTVNYDMLYRVPVADQAPQYEVIGSRYRETELYKTDRDFMPMSAEMSPRFAKRFPQIANSFDNLHMLHDNVNDILAQPSLSEVQKQEQVKIAIYRVLLSTHEKCTAGEGEENTLHDHRHPTSMPGMGMMKGSEEDVMFMSGMGWMDMSECAHCSIPLPESNPWGATVTAEGWTMTVRCLLCARDMAAETPGRAIIRAATEDPNRLLVMISDDEGNWTPNIKGVVFLETPGEHPECSGWSRAFTSTEAFEKYVKANEEFKGAKPLSLEEWAAKNGGKPDTYRKIDKPNPYRPPASNIANAEAPSPRPLQSEGEGTKGWGSKVGAYMQAQTFLTGVAASFSLRCSDITRSTQRASALTPLPLQSEGERTKGWGSNVGSIIQAQTFLTSVAASFSLRCSDITRSTQRASALTPLPLQSEGEGTKGWGSNVGSIIQAQTFLTGVAASFSLRNLTTTKATACSQCDATPKGGSR